jgi:hypothetical protein
VSTPHQVRGRLFRIMLETSTALSHKGHLM